MPFKVTPCCSAEVAPYSIMFRADEIAYNGDCGPMFKSEISLEKSSEVIISDLQVANLS